MIGAPTVQNGSPRIVDGLLWLLALTLAIRVGVLMAVPGALTGDPDGYRQLAENLVEHGTLGEGTQPTAYRPPLYPLLLAPCAALGDRAATAAIVGLHVLLGLGTVWLVWRVGQKCGLGRWALLAGALVACDPILLGQSTVVMTETAATFLVALALSARVCVSEGPSWWRAVGAGAALGLCGLCRPELSLWAAVCVPVTSLLWRGGKQKPSRDREGAVLKGRLMVLEDNGSQAAVRSLTVAARIGVGVAVLFGMIAVLLPWVVRNHIQFGRPIVATTHGGYTLLLANNPSFYEFLREGKPGAVWDARRLGPVWGGRAHHDSPAAELAADRQAYALAWQNIRREPAMFARSCAVRASRFWSLAPHQGSAMARRAIGAWYLAEFILAAMGISLWWHALRNEGRGRNSPRPSFLRACHPVLRACHPAGGIWLRGVLLAVSMTAVHAVFWSDMRMRGPLVPVVALAAAGGMAWLWGCVRASQAHAA